eukprot:TRINITY_DN63538_c0_g1_i1.p1 TRINITY_DN63538_c0_g1~~TRINITY_DN63538_c0_g1_i1.p1  ORF type:complete len:561 (+),score=69.45 TRINITY_DN63538_c0_g1_i1:56-1738(+)
MVSRCSATTPLAARNPVIAAQVSFVNPLGRVGVNAAVGDCMADDVVQRIADFASTMLLDILALAVVSRQYGMAMRRAVPRLLSTDKNDAQWLLTERMATNFLQWSQLRVCGYSGLGPISTADIEFPGDDALVYHCCRCRSPLLRFSDIISNNYHGAWGPAFLVNHLCNIEVESRAYAAAFVTGGYIVSDVSCSVCRLMLGKKYIQARDPVNRFKVGKFLLEQTMVFLPWCCSRTRPNSRQAKLSGPVGVCLRCMVHLQSRILQAAMLMTGNLHPGASRKLREILTEERQILLGSCQGNAGNCEIAKGKRISCRSSSGVDEIVASTECSRAIEQGGMHRLVSRRLALLCAVIPDGIEAKLFGSFVDGIASSMAAACMPEISGDEQTAQVGDVRSDGDHQHHTDRLQNFNNHNNGLAGRHGDRARGANAVPRVAGGTAAAAFAPAMAGVARDPLAAAGVNATASDAGKADTILAVARIIRWDVASQAAANVSRDFQIARGLVAGLKASWTPSWPAEKAGAERLVEAMVSKLSLDREDKDLLLQELGLKKPSTFCSWFPCRHG